MATHSSMLVWTIPMARRAWLTTVHMLPMLNTAEQLSTLLKYNNSTIYIITAFMLPFRHRRLEIKILYYCTPSASQSVKNLLVLQEIWGQSLGWEDPLEKEMATHSSILTGKISWTVEPDGLQSMGSQRVRPN